ncbi:hypothetical protein [Streptomyces sp. NPDC047014]
MGDTTLAPAALQQAERQPDARRVAHPAPFGHMHTVGGFYRQ